MHRYLAIGLGGVQFFAGPPERPFTDDQERDTWRARFWEALDAYGAEHPDADPIHGHINDFPSPTLLEAPRVQHGTPEEILQWLLKRRGELRFSPATA